MLAYPFIYYTNDTTSFMLARLCMLVLQPVPQAEVANCVADEYEVEGANKST